MVVAVSALLLWSPSVASEWTSAVFERVLPGAVDGGTCAVIVTVTVAPLAIVPRLQDTKLEPEQDPCVVVTGPGATCGS